MFYGLRYIPYIKEPLIAPNLPSLIRFQEAPMPPAQLRALACALLQLLLLLLLQLCRLLSKFDLRRLCKTVGATALPKMVSVIGRLMPLSLAVPNSESGGGT